MSNSRFTLTNPDADNAAGACAGMRFAHDAHGLAHYYRAVAARVPYSGPVLSGRPLRAYIIQALSVVGAHDGPAIWEAAR